MSNGGRLTAFDPNSPLTTPFLQWDTFMALVTAGFGLLAQVAPRNFLPDKLVGMKISGISAERYAFFPLSIVFLLYGVIAANLTDGNNVRGHASGLILSGTMSVACARAFPISPWYWLAFTVYSFYGILYHGRKLTLYTDGAPYWRSGDFSYIYAAFKDDRAAARAKKDAQKARRERIRSGGEAFVSDTDATIGEAEMPRERAAVVAELAELTAKKL